MNWIFLNLNHAFEASVDSTRKSRSLLVYSNVVGDAEHPLIAKSSAIELGVETCTSNPFTCNGCLCVVLSWTLSYKRKQKDARWKSDTYHRINGVTKKLIKFASPVLMDCLQTGLTTLTSGQPLETSGRAVVASLKRGPERKAGPMIKAGIQRGGRQAYKKAKRSVASIFQRKR